MQAEHGSCQCRVASHARRLGAEGPLPDTAKLVHPSGSLQLESGILHFPAKHQLAHKLLNAQGAEEDLPALEEEADEGSRMEEVD